jgi:hypothetical protein
MIFVAKLILTFVEKALISCLKAGKVVMHFLILSKLKKKFGRLIAFLILFYQIISITISYSEFETVIDMKAINNLESKPTISFCLKKYFQFPKVSQNSVLEKDFNDTIVCQRTNGIYKANNLYYKCSESTKIVESATPLSRRCRSYFSQLFDNKSIPESEGESFSFIIDDNIKVFVQIHQKRTPPHFVRQKIEISNSSFHRIDYIRTVTKLLPFPYSTDCSHYRNKEKSVINYRSKEDCIVKHLEEKEFIECGCNKRWFYGSSDGTNFSNICPKSIECKFDSKNEMKLLEKICKKDCLNEYYIKLFNNHFINNKDYKALAIYRDEKHEILFTYLPKMNFVEYLCSVGGLVSMWFGISVYDFVLIFVRETKNKLIQMFVLMNCLLVISAIVKFKAMITSKIYQIFTNITIIFFSVLMLIQVIEIISSYFDYEIVTRFEVQQIKLLPNIVLGFVLIPNNLNKLIEIYPEMKQKIHKYKEWNSRDRIKLHTIYRLYLLQLLFDNRLNDFHRIIETNKFIQTCQLKVDNDFELKNCTQGDFGIIYQPYKPTILMNRFNYSESFDKNKIEKITFVLNKFNYNRAVVELFLSYGHTVPKISVIIASKMKTTITFSSFLVKKLRSNQIECIPEENEKDFTEEYFNFCIPDCHSNLFNESLGCVPINGHFFNRKLLQNYGKFCDFSPVYNISLGKSVEIHCKKICKPKCNFVNLDAKVRVFERVLNETVLEVIPKKTPRIVYIETLKTDFNRLIYNCGGILGLWFGISPIKAVELFLYTYRILKITFTRVLQFLIAIWIEIKQNREVRQ